MKQATFDAMRQSFQIEQDGIRMLRESMNYEAFGKAIDLLMASSLIVTSACGSSGFAAQKFAHSLCCVESPAKFVSPAEAIHGGMGALKKGNALVLVSKGGKSDELRPLIQIAKAKECPIIFVTAHPETEMAKAADVILLLPENPESDRYGVMATSSYLATASIFDALMVGLMEEKDYPLSDFALIHPGGAVGKKIN